MSLLQEAHHPANISRRSLLTGALTAGAGVLSLPLVGCGNKSGDTSQNFASPIPGANGKENTTNKEGIITAGNWQFEATDWQEQSYQPNPGGPAYGQPDKTIREGWKYVTINGNMRNLGKNVFELHNLQVGTVEEVQDDGKNGYFTNNVVKFGLFTDDGNKYDINNFTYATSPTPPGFSNRFFLSGWVPEIQKSYGLSAVALTKQTVNGSPRPETIQKIKNGAVSKDSPTILPNVKINDTSKPWALPNFGEITYDRTFSVQGTGMADYDNTRNRYNTYRYASLNLKNNTGQNISPRDVSFVAYLKNGNTLSGTTSDYLATYNSNQDVAPGLNKSFKVHLLGLVSDLDTFDEIIKGGVLVGIGKDNWFAWQLP